MLAFAEGCRGQGVAVTYDVGAVNLTAYATADAHGTSSLILVNKDVVTDADIRITTGLGTMHARVSRLTAPSLDSKAGITLGGARVGRDGQWKGEGEPVRSTQGIWSVHVPATSAAIVRWNAAISPVAT
jgi:hypothetical protein